MLFWLNPYSNLHFKSNCNPLTVTATNIAPTTLSLFGTCHFLEAKASHYKDFLPSDLHNLARTILQRQAYLLYRWSLIRYLVHHKFKSSFLKRKWFNVTPDCFQPQNTEIDLYINQPMFLWRFSRNNYSYMCEIFAPPSSSNLKYNLLNHTIDYSPIMPYLENSNNLFTKSLKKLFQPSSSGRHVFNNRIYEIDYFNTTNFFRFNLNVYETSEFLYSDDFYLHQMDEYTDYHEFFLILLTGECKRYKCGLLVSNLLPTVNFSYIARYGSKKDRTNNTTEKVIDADISNASKNTSGNIKARNFTHATTFDFDKSIDTQFGTTNKIIEEAGWALQSQTKQPDGKPDSENNSKENSVKSDRETILSHGFSYCENKTNKYPESKKTLINLSSCISVSNFNNIDSKYITTSNNSPLCSLPTGDVLTPQDTSRRSRIDVIAISNLSSTCKFASISAVEAVERIQFLVNLRKESIKINHPLFLNTDWVSNALYSCNNHPYTFYRFVNELYGTFCNANHFKSINGEGLIERTGWKMPCSHLKQQWIASRYLETMPDLPWIFSYSLRLYVSSNKYAEKLKCLEDQIESLKSSFFAIHSRNEDNTIGAITENINGLNFNAVVKSALEDYMETVKKEVKNTIEKPVNFEQMFFETRNDNNKLIIKRKKPKRIIIADKFIKYQEYEFPHEKYFKQKPPLSCTSEVTFDLTPYFKKFDMTSIFCKKYREMDLVIEPFTQIHKKVADRLNNRFIILYGELIASIKKLENYQLFNYSNDKTIVEQICYDAEYNPIEVTPKVIPFKYVLFEDSEDCRNYVSEYICYYFIKHEPHTMCFPGQFIASRNAIQLESIEHAKFSFIFARDRYLSEIFTAFKYIQHEGKCGVAFDTFEFEEETFKLVELLESEIR